jgi:hypothetical protein
MTLSTNSEREKIGWQGELLSVQPRIRLTRSFDQRSHTYLGYSLKVRSRVGSEAREFLVAFRARRACQTPVSGRGCCLR